MVLGVLGNLQACIFNVTWCFLITRVAKRAKYTVECYHGICSVGESKSHIDTLFCQNVLNEGVFMVITGIILLGGKMFQKHTHAHTYLYIYINQCKSNKWIQSMYE